jgi:signal transduction histidine kinase/ligand-binding sensor domain-containing protein/DNA-binding response OmpR family regulator
MRTRHTLRAFALCAALGALEAGAAVPGAIPAAGVPEARPMYFEHLTMRDGLSQSTVMSILQDSQGYLWLGTESGLNRYDGYSVHEYRRERGNGHGLANDYVWSLAEDRSGDLWLATWGGGVARWERKTDRFESFRHNPADPGSLSSDLVRTLLIDQAGGIWAGTEEGLDMLDPRTRRARHFHHREGDPRSLASDRIFALHTDSRGQLWVGTDGGLSRYEPMTGDFVNVDLRAGGDAARPVRVRAIRGDRTGVLWVGTLDRGLIRFEPRTGRITRFQHDAQTPGSLSHDRVFAILEDDAQRLWVATSDGLNLFDRDSERFVRYGRDADNPQSLRDTDIMSLYQDRGGVLWVGTRAGGASHWNPRSWALGHYLSPLTSNVLINAFAESGHGKLWVGTLRGIVEIETSSRRERRPVFGTRSPALPDERVMALLHDRSGALWIGTMAGGLSRIDPASGSLRVFRHSESNLASLPADGVMSLYEDRSGTLWVGSYGGGLGRYDPASGGFERYPFGREDSTGLSIGQASAITEDQRGNLWIGTIGGGLNLFERRTGRFYHFRRRDGDTTSLSDDTVYALHVDSRGELWVGTAGGGVDHVIGSSEDPTAVRFESPQGLADMRGQVVYGIESDGLGRLWLSTNNGLVRFDPRTRAMKVFHEAHGLQGEDFNFNSHFRGRDGTLYFGGSNGFNAFAPDKEPAAAPPPRVVLTSARILDRTLAPNELPAPGRPLALAHNDKLVTFAFSALDFTSPENNRYRYRLEGFDTGWNNVGGQRSATYTNLDAGDYIFKVRAANADDVWNDDGLAIPLHVSAAPWDTPLAKVAYAAVALLILGYLWRHYRKRRDRELRYKGELERTVRTRTRELEERNEQLQVLSRAKGDFVARMSHELRTPMNAVLGMSELLLDTQLPQAQRRFVEGIHRSADSLLGIVDDVLDFSKIEAGRLQLAPVECDLTELVEQTSEMLAARAAAKAVEVLCDCPAHALPRVMADAVRLRQVLVNLGGNAVKFTEAGEVRLRLVPLGLSAGSLLVRLDVADTGIGIEPRNQSRIFEEFTQEDASTTRRFGGTGLGLSIVRQLVELMGGQLSLTSTPGVGSTFSFELALPLALATAAMPQPPSDLRGLRMLVAAENQSVRALIQRALTEWGVDCMCVSSLPETTRELSVAAYNAVVIDDSASNVDAGKSLEPALSQRAARPRVIRIRSFVSLAPDGNGKDQWFDAELTRPLRLMELHGKLTGRLGSQVGDVPAADTHTRTFTPLTGRVLVVEDQELNREVADGMLASFGLEVEAAEHGRQALAKLAADRYDVVLMDCQMPVMDGYSATRELRRLEAGGLRTPVIALTADMTDTARAACFAAGMDDYVGKPFTRATLHAVLSRWLATRKVAAGSGVLQSTCS